MADEVTPALFKELEGETFRVSQEGSDGEAMLALSVVREDPYTEGAPRAEPFTLHFSGPEGLQQGTYRFEHATIGAMDIFLVPIEPGVYEVIFN